MEGQATEIYNSIVSWVAIVNVPLLAALLKVLWNLNSRLIIVETKLGNINK